MHHHGDVVSPLAGGKMNEQEWCQAFLKAVKEDLDENLRFNEYFYKPVTREEENRIRKESRQLDRQKEDLHICAFTILMVVVGAATSVFLKG
jgi:hypothetical protein